MLVFVHIPKTGGTTFRAILAENERPERIRAFPNVFKGSGGLDKAPMVQLRKARGLLDKTLRDLDGTAILRGHVPLGVREYLPRYVPETREVHFLTFLREPVDRSVSHYFGICGRSRSAPGTSVSRSQLPAEPSFEDLLRGGYMHDNLQTRMLSGDPEPFGQVDDAMLERAKRNLREGLACFGITERFDESLVVVKQRLHLSSILYQTRARLNPARPRGHEVPSEVLRAAKRCNRYDSELYRYACELFEAAAERQELEFGVELAALRAASADGEIAVETPAPEGFAGSHQEWQMLLGARAALLRAERRQAPGRVLRPPSTARLEALENELRAARARAKQLERELNRHRAAASKTGELKRDVTRRRRASQTGRAAPEPAGARPKREARSRLKAETRSRPKREARAKGARGARRAG